MNNRPIGVFDSGLGGLTVVKELIELLPHEDIIYLGDTARAPYGNRSEEVITKFAFEDVNFLLQKKVKCIVVACHTVSAVAGKTLKKKIKIPVFDMIIPTSLGKTAVMGTRATINSCIYQVDYSVSCPLLVDFVEEGVTNGPALEITLHNYLVPLKSKNLSTLIMGCTHFPIIEKLIQKEMGKGVKLINPGKLAAAEVARYLSDHKMLKSIKTKSKFRFFVTDLTDQFVVTAEMFLGKRIDIQRIEIDND
jgi:glutamate racemase